MGFTVIKELDDNEIFIKLSLKDREGKMALAGYMTACALTGKKEERDKALELLNELGVFE